MECQIHVNIITLDAGDTARMLNTGCKILRLAEMVCTNDVQELDFFMADINIRLQGKTSLLSET
jgi:hypothetical protein